MSEHNSNFFTTYSYTKFQVDILELLMGSGVALSQTDDQGSSPLHLSCLRHNASLIKAIIEEIEKSGGSGDAAGMLDAPNGLGLTPFASVFWNYERGSKARDCINRMLDSGADPNVLMPYKEFSYLMDGCVPKYVNTRLYDERPD